MIQEVPAPAGRAVRTATATGTATLVRSAPTCVAGASRIAIPRARVRDSVTPVAATVHEARPCIPRAGFLDQEFGLGAGHHIRLVTEFRPA